MLCGRCPTGPTEIEPHSYQRFKWGGAEPWGWTLGGTRCMVVSQAGGEGWLCLLGTLRWLALSTGSAAGGQAGRSGQHNGGGRPTPLAEKLKRKRVAWGRGQSSGVGGRKGEEEALGGGFGGKGALGAVLDSRALGEVASRKFQR